MKIINVNPKNPALYIELKLRELISVNESYVLIEDDRIVELHTKDVIYRVIKKGYFNANKKYEDSELPFVLKGVSFEEAHKHSINKPVFNDLSIAKHDFNKNNHSGFKKYNKSMIKRENKRQRTNKYSRAQGIRKIIG